MKLNILELRVLLVADNQNVQQPSSYTLLYTTDDKEGPQTVDFGTDFKGALQAFFNRLK